MTNKGICWMDGRILPLQQARIPVTDHAVLYGDGVFEGVRFYGGRPFLLQEHLQRLFFSARAIGLESAWEPVSLSRVVQEVVQRFGASEGYLRILLTRGEGALGIDPRSCQEPRLVVIADELQMVDAGVRQRGADLVIASTRRLPPDGLDPRIKSLNYLNHILARMEANHAGADEAVLLNARGQVTEGTADNLFIARQGRLLTPPASDGALAGVTRGLILELATQEGIEAEEQSLASYDLYTADECFLTGTGAELIPVRSIDGRRLESCPGPLFRQLERAFRRFVEARCGVV